jgi:hypothetical protein
MATDTGKPIARLLLPPKEKANALMLFEHGLKVKLSAQETFFHKEQVKDIAIVHKKLLFPLIAGGILFPLSFLALFHDLFNPYWMLLVIMTGLFLLYYGLAGRRLLTIYTHIHEHDIAINTADPHLAAFIEFCSDYMSAQAVHQRVYIRRQSVSGGSDALPAYTHRQWLEQRKSDADMNDFIAIDPISTGVQVEYRPDSTDGHIRPFILRPLPEGLLHGQK